MFNRFSMPMRLVRTSLFVAWIIFALPVAAQILFDGSTGTLPGEQGWTYLAVGSATQTLTSNAVVLDSTPSTFTQAGYSRLAPSPLNGQKGFTLLFGSQVMAETHNNANRAGFSVIVLGDDKRGIELGFWTNLIFAQADTPLFTHAEDVPFPVGTGTVDYALTVLPTNYVLRANGAAILSGPVRDYTAFSGPINPYRTPNFIFFGDDTTSASASAALRQVVLVLPVDLVTIDVERICWTCISNLRYSVQGSTNLTDWSTLGIVTSPSVVCCFTNDSSPKSMEFFRVSYP